MARRSNSGKRKGSPKDGRPIKKKTSILTLESIEWVDYKDVNLLRRFMSERAKIRARRVTGNDRQQQDAVSRAIKLAREMALLPYSVRQVTQRKGSKRDRGSSDRRASGPPPRPDAPPPPPSAASDGDAAPAEPPASEATQSPTTEATTTEGGEG
jgi:small subunit ribosomal protein S18